MKKCKYLILFILVLQSALTLGQTDLVDNQKDSYLKRLRRKGVDSYIVLEIGSYSNQPYSHKTKTFLIFSKENDQVIIQKIDNLKKYSPTKIKSIEIFNLIEKNRINFINRDTFYRQEAEKEKRIHFIPPKQEHKYTYLTIHINNNFKGNVEIIDDKFDPSGRIISNEQWFEPLQQLINRLQSIVKTK